MINEILQAAEAALVERCGDGFCRAAQFLEELVPKVVTRLEELEQQLAEARTLAAMTEAELLEAQAKIKELEDV